MTDAYWIVKVDRETGKTATLGGNLDADRAHEVAGDLRSRYPGHEVIVVGRR